MNEQQTEPKCCYGTNGKCYCSTLLNTFLICGGSENYEYKNCCAYGCNNWSIPVSASGLGCRIHWVPISCLTNSECCAYCCSCLCCNLECGKKKYPYKYCSCCCCYPSFLCGNYRYFSSGHICNLSLCSMMQQCCLCHEKQNKCIC